MCRGGLQGLPIAKSVLNASAAASGDHAGEPLLKIAFDEATGRRVSVYDRSLAGACGRLAVLQCSISYNLPSTSRAGPRARWNAPEGSELTITGQRGASFREVTMPGRQADDLTATARVQSRIQSETVLHGTASASTS